MFHFLYSLFYTHSAAVITTTAIEKSAFFTNSLNSSLSASPEMLYDFSYSSFSAGGISMLFSTLFLLGAICSFSALLVAVYLQNKHIKRLRKHTKDMQNIVVRAPELLSENNPLTRLATIHHLGRFGAKTPEQAARNGMLLAAYVKSLSQDNARRQHSRTEIIASLLEISNLNKYHQQKTGKALMLDLCDCNFSHLTLHHLDLSGAMLRNTNFRSCSLHDVNFSEAQLDNAIFTLATLKETNLTNASLHNIDWTAASAHNLESFTAEAITTSPAKQYLLRSGKTPNTPRKDAIVTWLSNDMPQLDKSKLH